MIRKHQATAPQENHPKLLEDGEKIADLFDADLTFVVDAERVLAQANDNRPYFWIRHEQRQDALQMGFCNGFVEDQYIWLLIVKRSR